MLIGFFVALLVAFAIFIAAAQRHRRLPSWIWRNGGAIASSFAGVAVVSWLALASSGALQWWNPFSAFGSPKSADELPGAKVFRDGSCVRCHTIGSGKKTGPDLSGVGARFSRRELTAFIFDPDAYYRRKEIASINRGYPKMPPPGISEDAAEDAADFLIAKTREAGK